MRRVRRSGMAGVGSRRLSGIVSVTLNYRDYTKRLQDWATLGELGRYGTVVESGQDFPLFKLTLAGERWLTITSGFHGDERAGPLTLLEHMAEIVAYARERRVGLRVYPCVNPSGFEACTRYNMSGERPNNDLLRYEVAPGVWKGELVAGERFLSWKVFTEGPKETRALRAELEAAPVPDAALDIHQDPYLRGAFTYAYTFGAPDFYRPLCERSNGHSQIARSCLVDEQTKAETDEDGFIAYHDGSVTDYFMRRGTPFTAALETTTDTPLPACHQINLAWIRGFIDLAAGRPGKCSDDGASGTGSG